MAKIFVGVKLDEEVVKLIDKLAEKTERTRTAVIEDALDRGLENEEAFVRAMEGPIKGLFLKALASSGVVDVVVKAAGFEVDRRRKEMAKQGLKRTPKKRAPRGALA